MVRLYVPTVCQYHCLVWYIIQLYNSGKNARSYIGITSRTYIPARSMSNFSFSVRYLLQFRFWPHRRNWHVILRQHATFHQYRITSGGDMASYRFSRWRPLYRNSSSGFLFVDVTLTSEGQCLPANQISSTYLNSWPKYNYFRFGRTNVRILEFYFRFLIGRRAILKLFFRLRLWPHHRNPNDILDEVAKLHPYRTTQCGCSIILPVS